MRLTPTERDRLLIFTAAELARARRARGLRLNVPEATALIADTVCEAARDGARLAQAIAAGRSVLRSEDVLPGVAEAIGEIQVEAVFDDGTRLAVINDPFAGASPLGEAAPGGYLLRVEPVETIRETIAIPVRNTGAVPISVTSHFHFFEVNRRLAFRRSAAYGLRLAIPAGSSTRFDPGATVKVELVPIGGARIAIGFSGLVDGPLDSPDTREAAIKRAEMEGYAMTFDGGSRDPGPRETVARESARREAAAREAGARETAARNAAARETAARDAAARDAGARETGARETGARETGTRDTGAKDTAPREGTAREGSPR